MNKTIYRKFAKLAVQVGIGLKKGQPVIITASTAASGFAVCVAEECYRRGASKVTVDWINESVQKLAYLNQTLETLSHVPLWQEEKEKEKVSLLPCTIWIDDDDPNAFDGVDIDKMMSANQARAKVLKKYREQRDNKYQWTIISIPSKKWAAKVFPNEKPSAAVKKLWQHILSATRLDCTDPVNNWKNHISLLKIKAKILNELNFDSLHYKSKNGTDLTVGLHPWHLWSCAGGKTVSGNEYVANMPSEEVFTVPSKKRVDGVVYSSKPLSYNGVLIEDFNITFKNGKAVDCDARVGKEMLESLLKMDDGASRLGEVALVPYDSPVSNLNTLFYNTLFDENASCHLALGFGITDAIKGYETMEKADFDRIGVNDSIIHVDFMIGNSDLEITGTSKDGQTVRIFKNGNWAI